MAEYIDKQAALDRINQELRCGATADQCGLETAYDLLHNIPPADVKPMVRGRWYKPAGMMPPEFTGFHRCTECEELALRDWKSHKQVLTPFCPFCNADLRGGDPE